MVSSSKSAMVHILLGLLPYSKQNLLLAHNPNKFFNHLEQQSGYSRLTLQKTMSRAKKQGFLWQEDNLLKITDKGKQFVRRYEAQKLNKDVYLMVIFDIPEHNAVARRRLRKLLRQWKFSQVQKSVWASEYDFRAALIDAIKELEIETNVQIFEGAKLYPNK